MLVRRVFWIGLGLLALGWGYLAWEIYTFGESNATQPADAAIVLGAGVWRDRPSPVLRERINHAVGLYNAGYVDKLIFTGGVGAFDELSEGEVAGRYALAAGVPADDILLEETSHNTIENLRNARSVAGQHGLNTFLIVSTPFHMKRAMWIAEDLGLEAYPSPTRTIRWISPLTKGRALVQETISFMRYAGRRTIANSFD